jgi:hypothetical protein
VRRLGFLVVAVLLVGSACNPAAKLTATSADAQMVQAVFPLIERLRVDEYSNDEAASCRDLQEPRGNFVSDISPESPCDPARFTNPELFDSQATADFDALTAAFRSAGVQVNGFGVTRSAGVIQTGGFSIGCGDVLIYEPGYGPLSNTEEMPYQKLLNRPLTPDWYEEASSC